jgi:hypothetical protein
MPISIKLPPTRCNRQALLKALQSCPANTRSWRRDQRKTEFPV